MKTSLFDKIFDILLIALFLSLGAFLLWNTEDNMNIHARYSIPLGSVLSAYGLFKLYRWYHRYINH
jgi:hypothetical protein